jgi:hypothetical protein
LKSFEANKLLADDIHDSNAVRDNRKAGQLKILMKLVNFAAFLSRGLNESAEEPGERIRFVCRSLKPIKVLSLSSTIKLNIKEAV